VSVENSQPGALRIPPGALRWGATVFVLATIAGFTALFLITRDVSGSLTGFRQFDPVWILPCLLLSSLDWFGGGLRIWLLARPLQLRLPYRRCVQISGATAAMASLTPSGTGGGPAQLYGLMRNGVPLGRAVAMNFASVLVNLTFLSLAGFGAWFFGAASALEDIRLPVANLSAARLFEWSALGFAVIATVVILLAASPRAPRAIVVRTFGSSRKVRKWLRHLQELHGSIIIYARKGKLALLFSTMSGVFQFGGRFLLGWAVLRGFGIDVGLWNIVVLHIMLQFLLYFMPTPGGSGIAEILAPAVMSPFMPESLLVAYTAVWRFFLTYVTVLVGGTMIVRWIGRDQKSLTNALGAVAESEARRTAAPAASGEEAAS
jgi:glycosyltransferase 2 family protein